MDVRGKTINDLLSLDEKDFLRLDRADLAKVVTRLASAANKRVRSIEKRGISTPATRQVRKSTGLFSVKEKNVNQLRAEYVRVKEFLKNETSTIKGYKAFVKDSIEKLKKAGIKISEENFTRYEEIYDAMRDADPSIDNRKNRYRAKKLIAELVETDLTDEQIIVRVKTRMGELYEEEQQQRHTSDFFELS